MEKPRAHSVFSLGDPGVLAVQISGQVLLGLLAACVVGTRAVPVAVGSGAGIVMAYEVTGRVTSDDSGCFAPVSDVSVALFDMSGTLLDETRTDAQGKFLVGVRNPDAAEGMLARLDGDDPTVQVSLRVQGERGEQSFVLRLPRPVQAKEYRVRLAKRPDCVEM